MHSKKTLPPIPLLEEIVEGIADRKGEVIRVADLTEIDNAACDYFIICQGNSPTQVNAIADSISERVQKNTGEKPWHIEGKANAEWILMDYVNMVVHIFQKDVRSFYGLDELWADAPVYEVEFKY